MFALKSTALTRKQSLLLYETLQILNIVDENPRDGLWEKRRFCAEQLLAMRDQDGCDEKKEHQPVFAREKRFPKKVHAVQRHPVCKESQDPGGCVEFRC